MTSSLTDMQWSALCILQDVGRQIFVCLSEEQVDCITLLQQHVRFISEHLYQRWRAKRVRATEATFAAIGQSGLATQSGSCFMAAMEGWSRWLEV